MTTKRHRTVLRHVHRRLGKQECTRTRALRHFGNRVRTTMSKSKQPIFLIAECSPEHMVEVRTPGSNKRFKLVYDSGSQATYIDLEMAQAWGFMAGRKPLVPHTESTTVDSNGNIHKSIRLNNVTLEILCPDGVYRPATGAVEVNMAQKVNKFGRLFGVSHIRTLRDTVRYIVDYQKCNRRKGVRH